MKVSVRTGDQIDTSSQRQRTLRGEPEVAHHDEQIRSLSEPTWFRRIGGRYTSSGSGDGCELVDMREYRQGDPRRWVNGRSVVGDASHGLRFDTQVG